MAYSSWQCLTCGTRITRGFGPYELCTKCYFQPEKVMSNDE